MGLCLSRKSNTENKFVGGVTLHDTNHNNERVAVHTYHDRFIKSARAAWAYMHCIAQNLSENPLSVRLQDYFMQQIILVGTTVCCTACGDHWVTIMESISRHRTTLLSTPHVATCFLFDIHNLWNVMRGVPAFTWSRYQLLYGYTESYTSVIDKVMKPDVVMLHILASDIHICVDYPPKPRIVTI